MTVTQPTIDPLDQVAKDAADEQREAAAAAAGADAKPPKGKADAKPKAPPKPKGGARPGAGRPKATSEAARMKGLESRLRDTLAMLGMGLALYNPEDGAAVLENAEPLAKALNNLAQENASVRRVLLGLLEGSAWGGVLMAATPIALRIAVNHDVIKRDTPLGMMVGGAPRADGPGVDPAARVG